MTADESTANQPLPALRVGEHLTEGANELYCLSPRPVPLDLPDIADVARLVLRKGAATLDLMQGGPLNGMLAWGGGVAVWVLLFFVFLFFFAMGTSLLSRGVFSWWEALASWGGGFYLAILFCGMTGLVFPDALMTGTPPVRFHRQRREVAFVVQHPGRRVWLPSPRHDLMIGLWFALFASSGGSAIVGINIFGPYFSLIMLVCHVLVLPGLLFGYRAFYGRCRRRAGWVRETVFVPWEDVVAVATRNVSFTLGGATGLGWNLIILPPDPERPGYSLAGAGISASVGGLPGAMIQWELIRRYMEEGADAVPERADDYSVAWYKGEMARQRERHASKGKRFWRYRMGRWMELAWFASWYTEYRIEHVLPKAAPKGWLAEWSKPLPENEWARPSRELTELSAQVRAAYQRGETFIELGPIEERFGNRAGDRPRVAYRSVPFAAHQG